MAKRYKTDYFEKLSQLSSICSDNISITQKIMYSEYTELKKNAVTGKNIMQEIKTSLSKDFFAPFDREDIFIISEILYELSENSQLLCIYSKESDLFSVTSDLRSLIECLKNITESISAIITQLSKFPKQGDLTVYFSKTEILLYDFKKYFLVSSGKEKNKYPDALLQIAKECAQNCKEIIELIQYTLIKNS